MNNIEKYNKLKEYLEEIKTYNHAISLISFDQETIVPKKAFDKESETIAKLADKAFRIKQSKEFTNLVKELHNDSSELNIYQKRLIELLYRSYENDKNITPEFNYEFNITSNKAYSSWLEAKKAKDYKIFKEDFKKMIELTRKSIELRESKKETIYDTLLDDFEKGGSIKQLDSIFNELKATIIPLLKSIQDSGVKYREDFLSRKISIDKQEKFSKYLMQLIGLDMDATLLSTTEHPFTSMICEDDVRITTHYYEDMFISNIFSTIHEGGHALYAQNEGHTNHEYYINDMMSSGTHECMSRLFENMIGRNKNFIHYIYPKLIETFPEFKDVSEEELYQGVNIAKASLIRTEADELTYCLHIIIRYELEKDFINGKISVDEIPDLWNKKYKEYLGITVPDDSMGVLQDVHWAGSYGYFPSYALGNIYAAQIMHYMKKDIDVDNILRNGEVFKIRDWLTKHAYQIGSLYDPYEWIVKVTKEEINPKYYLDYLTEKYSIKK